MANFQHWIPLRAGFFRLKRDKEMTITLQDLEQASFMFQQFIAQETERQQRRQNELITENQLNWIKNYCDRNGLDRPKDLEQWTKKQASEYIGNHQDQKRW